ncbi:MAG: protein kinase [Synechococcaceae cyanobacterium SM2_3_1]|nr:protein kinase [Synechococcaceae cyanobacterium SM2_3_1]
MSYCINPTCHQPQNQKDSLICQSCRSEILLDKRFRALKRIGHGGFGRTFLAVDEDQKAKTFCVIKQFFLKGLDPDHSNKYREKASELFQQEAQRLEELSQHTQIPTLLAYVEQKGQQYLVQEYIEGMNLAEELTIQGPFSEAKIQQLLQNLLPVLHFIHSYQIIHRDIKPSNIIRRRGQQQLVLVDFGAARTLTDTALDRTGTIIGTAEYTAPEQVRGKAVFASDLYSLGVTCLHLMTCMSPFELFDDGDGVWIWRDYLPEGKVNPTLGQVLDQLIQSTTRRRYATAYEALKVLNPLQARFLQLSIGGSPDLFKESTPLRLPDSPQALAPVLPQWICRHSFQQPGAVTALAFSPSENYAISGGPDGVIRILDVKTGQQIRELTGHQDKISALSFSSGGQYVVSTSHDRVATVWDIDSGQPIIAFADHRRGINAALIHPDEARVITGGADELIKIWELQTGRVIQELKGHAGPIRCLTLSPDTQLLASGSEDASIRLWDLTTGQLCHSVAAFYPIFSVAISSDQSSLAGGGYDNSVKVWDLATGLLNCIYTDHANWVTSVDISPDSQILVSGSDDYTIKLRHLPTRRLFAVLMEHSGRITHVQFSRSGLQLISGCTDGWIKVWQKVFVYPS